VVQKSLGITCTTSCITLQSKDLANSWFTNRTLSVAHQIDKSILARLRSRVAWAVVRPQFARAGGLRQNRSTRSHLSSLNLS
jgi:hypothetical protein